MREIHRKITDGTATPAEAEEFSQWSKQLAEGAAAEFGDAVDKETGDLPVAATGSDGNRKDFSHCEANVKSPLDEVLRRGSVSVEPGLERCLVRWGGMS
jgi:hypothetical protein